MTLRSRLAWTLQAALQPTIMREPKLYTMLADTLLAVSHSSLLPCRDHAGGNAELAALVPGIPIYGGAHDGVACCTNQLHDRDCVEVDDVTVMAVETP